MAVATMIPSMSLMLRPSMRPCLSLAAAEMIPLPALLILMVPTAIFLLIMMPQAPILASRAVFPLIFRSALTPLAGLLAAPRIMPARIA